MKKGAEISPKKGTVVMIFFAVVLGLVLFLSQFKYKPVSESSSESIPLTQFEVISDWNNGFRIIEFSVPNRTSEICVESKHGALSCIYSR